VLTGIALFLLLVIALLAIPVAVMFQVSRRQAFQGHITLKWAFGLVRVRIPLSEATHPSPDIVKRPRKISRPKRKRTNRATPFSLLKQRAFLRRILKFISDLWHAIQKRNVILHIRLGLGDPADTGQLWAIIGPIAGMLANVKEARLEIEPEFMDAVFELDGSGTIQLIPLQIIYLALALFLSPPVWRGIKQMRTVE